MVFEEFSVLADGPSQFLPFLFIQINRRSLFKVIILLGRRRILISSLPSVPRPLNIIPLHYFFLSIEDIGHNDEVTSADLIPLIVLLDQLMQAEEFCDEGVRVLFEVVVVILEDGAKEFVLAVADGL